MAMPDVKLLQVQDSTLPCSSDIATQMDDVAHLVKGFSSAEPYLHTPHYSHELMQLAWDNCNSSPAADQVCTIDSPPRYQPARCAAAFAYIMDQQRHMELPMSGLIAYVILD